MELLLIFLFAATPAPALAGEDASALAGEDAPAPALLVAQAGATPAPAKEEDEEGLDDFFAETPEPHETYVAPHDFKLELGAGVRFFSAEGSHRASEYLHEQTWPTLDGHLGLYGIGKHRVKADTVIRNPRDFCVDGVYGLGELLQVRLTGTALHHDTEAPTPLDLGPDPRFSVGTGELPDHRYIDTQTGRLKVMLKLPDFPAHLVLDGWLHHRTVNQARPFLGGSGHFDDLALQHAPDLASDLFQEGSATLNSHLGPVELSFIHRQVALTPLSAFETYRYEGALPLGAGEYARNLSTVWRGHTEELALNSDNSGMYSLVGRLRWSEVANPRADLKGRTLGAYLAATARPFPSLSLRGSVSGRTVGWRGPDTATITNVTTGETTAVPARPPLDRNELITRLRLRYRVNRDAVLDLRFRRQDLQRPDGSDWGLSPYTIRSRIGARVKVDAHRTITVEGGYEHEWIAAPALNTEPDATGKTELSLTWRPSPHFSARGRYQYAMGMRESLAYEVSGVTVRGGARRTGSHNAQGSVTINTNDGITLLLLYGYMQVQVGQELAYDLWSTEEDTPFLRDPLALYQHDLHQVVGDLSWRPLDWLHTGLRVSTNSAHSRFTPTEPLALEPVSIAAFSSGFSLQYRVDAYLRLQVHPRWTTSLTGGWRSIDQAANPYDPWPDSSTTFLAVHVMRSFE
ncbi:MAG: hypothetical protein P1V51_03695 [Deltaproteobacteria bacterium]|nr:hypothetical protein [Deltaproteobacteria bacterium]